VLAESGVSELRLLTGLIYTRHTRLQHQGPLAWNQRNSVYKLIQSTLGRFCKPLKQDFARQLTSSHLITDHCSDFSPDVTHNKSESSARPWHFYKVFRSGGRLTNWRATDIIFRFSNFSAGTCLVPHVHHHHHQLSQTSPPFFIQYRTEQNEMEGENVQILRCGRCNKPFDKGASKCQPPKFQN